MTFTEVLACFLAAVSIVCLVILWVGGIDKATDYKPEEKTGWMDWD